MLFGPPPGSILPAELKVELRRKGSASAIVQAKQEEALFSLVAIPR